MRLTRGQAARQGAVEAAGRAGRLVHWLIQLVVVLFFISLIGCSVLAVRLAQGPLPVAWVARQLATAVSTDGRTLSIGGAELTWEGLHGGVDRPLDIVLRNIVFSTTDGGTHVKVPRAEVSLSLLELLFGRAVPRAVAVDGLQISLDLTPQPGATAAVGDADWHRQLTDILTGLRARPSHAFAVPAIVNQLRRVVLTNACLALQDSSQGLHGALSGINIDMLRASAGGAGFRASATLELGGAVVPLHLSGELQANTGDLVLAYSADRFMPPTLAANIAQLEPLNLAQLPISLSGTAQLDPQLAPRLATVDLTAEHGTLLLGDGALPVRSAALHASLTPSQITLQLHQLVLQATDSSPPTHVSAEVTAHQIIGAEPRQLAAELSVDIDQVAVDDIAALWPLGLGGPGTRPWLVANAHNGVLRSGHVAASLTAPTDFSDAVVTKLSGGIDGSDISITWLSPVPPVEHASGHLVFVDPDTMDIFLTGGKQATTQLVAQSGKLRMTGLAAHDQFLALNANLSGPFADLMRLLHHKRIGLLDRLKFQVNNPSGQMNGKLSVSLPLKTDLAIEEVAIRGTGQVVDAHIGGIAAGRDIDHANFDFDVSNAGLTINGPAQIAGVSAQIAAMMDFTPGGAAQVQEKVDATTTLTADQLTKFGANPQNMLSGSTTARLIYQERRGGGDDLALTADLTGTAITDPLLNWSKSADTAGKLDLHAAMRNQKLIAVDRLRADAPGLLLRATAEAEAGQPSVLHIDTLRIGDSTDMSGTLRLPQKAGDTLVADITGPKLDLSALLTHPSDENAQPDTTRGAIYRVSAHLDQVTMAGGQIWKNVSAQVASDGWITTGAEVSASAGTGLAALHIVQGPKGRTMLTTAADAGAFLRGLDVSQRVVDGTLSASGQYDDSNAAHRLSGTAQLENFRIRNAPAIGKLLQALSVYGIFEATSGPGLALTRMTAPFDLTTSLLTLKDARAVSPSLGFTAKGTINLNAHVAQIEGTVIPLYFFNSLLGKLPLVGKLFSPETEGGLLAMSFSIRGKLDDPSVLVNPLSALTPGVLRGFFDIFGPSSPSPPGSATPP